MIRLRDGARGINANDTIRRWTILGPQFSRGRDKQGKIRWAVVARCECGTVSVVDVGELARGKSQSCGCFIGDSKLIHGHRRRRAKGVSEDPLYSIWRGMRDR